MKDFSYYNTQGNVFDEWDARYEDSRIENAKVTRIIEAELGHLNEDRMVARGK